LNQQSLVKLTLFLFISLLIAVSSGTAGIFTDIEGDVVAKLHGDTLLAKYQFDLGYLLVDSIMLGFPRVKSDGVSDTTFVTLDSSIGGRREWCIGQLELPSFGEKIPSAYIFREYMSCPTEDSSDSTVETCHRDTEFALCPTGNFGRRSEVGWGYNTRSGFPKLSASDPYRITVNVTDRLQYHKRYYTLGVGYSIHHDRLFTLYDYLRFEGEVAFWG